MPEAPRRTHAAILPAVLVGLAALTTFLAACSSDDAPRPVTQEEAERLALARMSVYDLGIADVELSVPVEDQTLRLQGLVDTQDHAGYALVTTQDDPPQHALLQWTLDDKAIAATDATSLPAAPPGDGWTAAALVPADPLDSALLVTLNLASDRPENPLLLRQNGAMWAGTDTVDGRDVDVFLGPGDDGTTDERIRYLVDDDGTLLRVEADTGADDPLVIDLAPSAATDVPLVAALTDPDGS